jgi:hypothetical protein
MMYAGKDFAYSTGAAPYNDAGNGPYSHYVDNTNSKATDTDNPYGTKDKPRVSIPKDLPAGSVVEVHGGPYSTGNFNGNGYIGLYGIGTAAQPIFIRGVPGALPTFSRNCIVFGSYVIYENLSFINDAYISHRPELAPGGATDSDHLVFRHLVMTGTGTTIGNIVAISGLGQWSDPTLPLSRNCVVWDCTITNYGDWQSDVENDAGGVIVGGFNATDIWILNNTISHSGGDACRIGSNPVTQYPTYTARRLYVGGNTFFDNRENGLDIKGCYDAIISQNNMWGARPTSSSNGEATAGHYKCDNIWIIFNTIHDSTTGLSLSDGLGFYFIGNVVYDCDNGVKFWSSNTIAIVGNTFAGFQTGINDIGGTEAHPIINNIFTGLTDKVNGYQIKLLTTAANLSDMKNNSIYEKDGTFRVYWSKLYTSIDSLKIGTGKAQGCLVSDPKFVNGTTNDFHLQAESPAIDAATTPSTYTALFAAKFPGNSIAFDRDGIPRPQGPSWDIGAYEYNAEGNPTPTPNPPQNLQVQEN